MKTEGLSVGSDHVIAPSRMGLLVLLAVFVFVLAALVFWMINRASLAAVLVATPVGLALVTNPRWALYQFVFCCYLLFIVVESVPLILLDISALILIVAAFLDVTLSDRPPRRMPVIAWWYIAFVVVLCVSGIFGYAPERVIRPLARVVFLLGAFLGAYRLSRHVSPTRLLQAFFWLGVAHSLIALVPFIASGGIARSFGFSLRILDELSMLALPVGVSFAVWSPRWRLSYLLGSLVVLGALVGTQSRAPIGFGVLAAGFVLLVGWWRSRKSRSTSSSQIDDVTVSASVARRIGSLAVLAAVLPLVLVAVKPTLLLGVYERFDSLVRFEPTGTLLLRVQLWERAMEAFLDHPVLGMGPAMFQHYGDVYPGARFNPYTMYISGLSAHNMTLHYLAETGLIGAGVVVGMFATQFGIARRVWKKTRDKTMTATASALYAIGLLLLVSTLIEAGWLFGGQAGFLASFFMALISRANQALRGPSGAPPST
ncbi:MAG: O-antigen ligase family protein [candidate division Zixibacteria bacterium]|jgi:O-antigen ligase|nr:O-antigen ligase family protein [candidate division Zixibacteria bacterium]